MKLGKWAAALFLALLVNTAYLAAFASPTVFYMSNVLLHLGLGLALAVCLALLLVRHRGEEWARGLAPAAALFFLSLLAGLWLTWAGNIFQNRWLLWTHIATAGLGVLALVPWAWRQPRFRNAFVACAALLILWPRWLTVWPSSSISWKP